MGSPSLVAIGVTIQRHVMRSRTLGWGAFEFLIPLTVFVRELDRKLEVGEMKTCVGIDLPSAASEDVLDDRCVVGRKGNKISLLTFRPSALRSSHLMQSHKGHQRTFINKAVVRLIRANKLFPSASLVEPAPQFSYLHCSKSQHTNGSECRGTQRGGRNFTFCIFHHKSF